MPHLVILYTPQLDAESDIGALCRSLAGALRSIKDEDGQQAFPTGGIRVLAYPAAHSAVADGGVAGRAAGGSGDYAFAYFNLRIAHGRSEPVKRATGDALTQAARTHFAPLLAKRPIGLTLQIDEGPEVFDAKFGNLHPLFNRG